jgi:hypothetical protein
MNDETAFGAMLIIAVVARLAGLSSRRDPRTGLGSHCIAVTRGSLTVYYKKITNDFS